MVSGGPRKRDNNWRVVEELGPWLVSLLRNNQDAMRVTMALGDAASQSPNLDFLKTWIQKLSTLSAPPTSLERCSPFACKRLLRHAALEVGETMPSLVETFLMVEGRKDLDPAQWLQQEQKRPDRGQKRGRTNNYMCLVPLGRQHEIRESHDTSSNIVRLLDPGDIVTIEETQVVDQETWGKTSSGWVLIKDAQSDYMRGQRPSASVQEPAVSKPDVLAEQMKMVASFCYEKITASGQSIPLGKLGRDVGHGPYGLVVMQAGGIREFLSQWGTLFTVSEENGMTCVGLVQGSAPPTCNEELVKDWVQQNGGGGAEGLAGAALMNPRKKMARTEDGRLICKYWTGSPGSCGRGANCNWVHLDNPTTPMAGAKLHSSNTKQPFTRNEPLPQPAPRPVVSVTPGTLPQSSLPTSPDPLSLDPATQASVEENAGRAILMQLLQAQRMQKLLQQQRSQPGPPLQPTPAMAPAPLLAQPIPLSTPTPAPAAAAAPQPIRAPGSGDTASLMDALRQSAVSGGANALPNPLNVAPTMPAVSYPAPVAAPLSLGSVGAGGALTQDAMLALLKAQMQQQQQQQQQPQW